MHINFFCFFDLVELHYWCPKDIVIVCQDVIELIDVIIDKINNDKKLEKSKPALPKKWLERLMYLKNSYGDVKKRCKLISKGTDFGWMPDHELSELGEEMIGNDNDGPESLSENSGHSDEEDEDSVDEEDEHIDEVNDIDNDTVVSLNILLKEDNNDNNNDEKSVK